MGSWSMPDEDGAAKNEDVSTAHTQELIMWIFPGCVAGTKVTS